jgi:hypothetical protein
VDYSFRSTGGGDTGGLHVHTGQSCAKHKLVGGHLWEPSDKPDPWDAVKWLDHGSSKGGSGSVVVPNTGLGLNDASGRAVVLHRANGDRYACGVLGVRAVMRAYPNTVDSSTFQSGSFLLSENPDGSLAVHFAFFGNAGDSGEIHVYSGTSCQAHSSRSNWAGVKWTGNSGAVTIPYHWNIAALAGRVLVLHDSKGKKWACGVLSGARTGRLSFFFFFFFLSLLLRRLFPSRHKVTSNKQKVGAR